MIGVTPVQLAVLTVTGLLAGAANAVAGGGSMLSFPALLALGLPPVTANVTNSVAALPGYLGGSLAYRPELTGQRGRIVRLGAVSTLGATAGAITLLTVSAETFRAVVPWLVLASAVLLAAQPWLVARLNRHRVDATGGAALMSAQFAAAFYGGFFMAGLGIVILATLGMFLDDTTQRLNALKGALSLVIGMVVTVTFGLLTPVAWGPAALLALTGLAGGRLGVQLARRISAPVLRWTVAAWGAAIAVSLEVSRHVS
ncbi:sulfite exporter TauE/SafE family protein [Nocardia sp. NBC_00508]|uniref:sulfite exporter TauE/SafE family protein n=1 Tax=Nocardia sp. NBC_00508 TaxID=2975992 RepID=UPI002E818DD7|nr:sulfite exporter TauE/SafE family protein [Nocardia sp. NBC_00508]WUD68212.1 sulfite exporter TauE/SafE family protein [Nocardia sp. NBC_00508]